MDYNIMTVQYQLQQSSFQRDRLRRKLKRLKTQLTYEQHFEELQKMYEDFSKEQKIANNDNK